MEYHTYILFNVKLNKFYIGSAEDLQKRIIIHNKGQVKFTAIGIPWTLVWSTSCISRAEAVRLEYKIKKRGARRYLSDINFQFDLPR